jgi:hypothetical protein
MKLINTSLLRSSILPTVWQNLMNSLLNGFELQVWQTHLRNGNCSWHAYDPMTGHSACFGSEDDMRVWIEQRYYKN